MRLLIETGYSNHLITRDLTVQELAAVLDAFDGALAIQSEGYGDEAKRFVSKDRVASDIWRIVDANDDRVPREIRFAQLEAESQALREVKVKKTTRKTAA